MAKNVKIRDVNYGSVSSIAIPLSDTTGDAIFVDTDSGDSLATDIRNGKKSWVKGAEVVGSVPVRSVSDLSASGNQVTVPAGIYDNQEQITVDVPIISLTNGVLSIS